MAEPMVLERHPLAFGCHLLAEERLRGGRQHQGHASRRAPRRSLSRGRDPTTDVAVLRFQPDGLPIASIADGSLRPGHIVLAVGNYEGGPLAALGIIAIAGGPWHSARGGTIDSLIRLDLALSPAAEGGALIDAQGRVVGMAVLGPRRRALAIPGLTINRAVDQLLARGHVFRGYLGVSLQLVKREPASNGSQSLGGGRGVLVVGLDPDGPSARAGMLVGDIVTAWDGKPINRVREVVRLLGSESVGRTVDLSLIRAAPRLRSRLSLASDR